MKDDESLARMLKHPLRQRLLFEYAGAVVSPSKVAARMHQPLNVVSYHTQVLHRAGCLELVRAERRRGATEHYYRAATARQFGDDAWGVLSVAVRRSLVRSTLDAGWREAREALASGGMDAADAHVSRSFLTLDGEARDRLSAALRDAFEAAKEIEAASLARGATGAVPYELVVMSFARVSGPAAGDEPPGRRR
jgi:hypothetical protein